MWCLWVLIGFVLCLGFNCGCLCLFGLAVCFGSGGFVVRLRFGLGLLLVVLPAVFGLLLVSSLVLCLCC